MKDNGRAKDGERHERFNYAKQKIKTKTNNDVCSIIKPLLESTRCDQNVTTKAPYNDRVRHADADSFQDVCNKVRQQTHLAEFMLSIMSCNITVTVSHRSCLQAVMLSCHTQPVMWSCLTPIDVGGDGNCMSRSASYGSIGTYCTKDWHAELYLSTSTCHCKQCNLCVADGNGNPELMCQYLSTKNQHNVSVISG